MRTCGTFENIQLLGPQSAQTELPLRLLLFRLYFALCYLLNFFSQEETGKRVKEFARPQPPELDPGACLGEPLPGLELRNRVSTYPRVYNWPRGASKDQKTSWPSENLCCSRTLDCVGKCLKRFALNECRLLPLQPPAKARHIYSRAVSAAFIDHGDRISVAIAVTMALAILRDLLSTSFQNEFVPNVYLEKRRTTDRES